MTFLEPGTAGMQMAGILFGIFMIYITFLYWKRNEIGVLAFIIFILTWISFIFLALFPATLDPLLEGLRFARRLDFFIIAGFMFLIFICFHSYHQVYKLKYKLEELVQRLAKDEKES